ncbi:MAG: hypothetical protein SGPRY_012992 [Prymnesium sp.]
MACANATPPQPARGAALLAELRGGGGQPSGEAANAVLAALCNAAMGRPNPACVNSAYELLSDMVELRLQPRLGCVKKLLLAATRTTKHLITLKVLEVLAAHPQIAEQPAEEALMRSVLVSIGSAIEAGTSHGVSKQQAVLSIQMIAASAPPLSPSAAAAQPAQQDHDDGGADPPPTPEGGDGEGLEENLCRALCRLGLSKQLCGSLVRVSCVGELFRVGSGLLRLMIDAREPPMAPGVGLLATYLVGCAGSAAGTRAGVEAFSQLSSYPLFSAEGEGKGFGLHVQSSTERRESVVRTAVECLW